LLGHPAVRALLPICIEKGAIDMTVILSAVEALTTVIVIGVVPFYSFKLFKVLVGVDEIFLVTKL
jgi:hypothetical protein